MPFIEDVLQQPSYGWKNEKGELIKPSEWHNNHHLFPVSARAGFLPYQLDLAWIYIFSMYKLGAVSSYRDSKREFLRKHFQQRPV
jgi:hypothetical protein